MANEEDVIDRQLAAYNAHDLDAWLATYAPDAQQWLIDGTLLASGRAQLRERMRARFLDGQLHAELLHRVRIGDTVADHERISRTGSLGMESLEMLCIYTVREGLIARATFAMGDPRPFPPAASRPMQAATPG